MSLQYSTVQYMSLQYSTVHVPAVQYSIHVPAVQYKPPGLRLPVQQRPARALAPRDGEVNDSLLQSGHLVYNDGLGYSL